MQYSGGDFGSRLKEMSVPFAILETRPDIPFFPSFMLHQAGMKIFKPSKALNPLQ
jgi:hypothetical protein